MLHRIPLPAAVVVVLAVATVAVHAAVLGWDTRYDVDPATGLVSGPYEAWQVVLGGLLLVVLVTAAAWRGPARLVAVVPVVFTLAWSAAAATAPDGDGLWPVGALLVAAGTGLGAWACDLVVRAVRDR